MDTTSASVMLYNGEHFERGIWWKCLAGIAFLGLVGITLFSSALLGNHESWMPTWTDILSTLLFLAMLGAYRFYVRKEIEKKIIVRIDEDALYLGDRRYQRHGVQSFSMEKNRVTDELYSIVFMINHHYKIHTIADTQEQIIAFAHALKEYIPFREEINLSAFEKLLRRAKI